MFRNSYWTPMTYNLIRCNPVLSLEASFGDKECPVGCSVPHYLAILLHWYFFSLGALYCFAHHITWYISRDFFPLLSFNSHDSKYILTYCQVESVPQNMKVVTQKNISFDSWILCVCLESPIYFIQKWIS